MKHDLNLSEIDESRAAKHLQRMVEDRPKTTRIVSRGQVYIQRPGEQPEQIDVKSIIDLPPGSGEDQIWMRMYKLTQDWQPLDYGWIEKPARVVVSNLAGTNLGIIPDDKTKTEIAQNVVELTFEQNINEPKATHILILPGDSFNFVMDDFSKLRIRTRKAGTKIKIHAFPSN